MIYEVELFHECPCCGVETFGNRYCFDCQELMAELEPEAQRYVETASQAPETLRNLAWGSVAVAVLWYLIWCYRDFILACWDLWFGGGPQ